MDTTNKEQEAKEAWKQLILNRIKQIEVMPTNIPYAVNLWCNQTLDDSQSVIIEALEKEKLEYIEKREGQKKNSIGWHTYDHGVRICDHHISLVKTIKPK